MGKQFIGIIFVCLFLCGCVQNEAASKMPRFVCQSSELCKYSETPFPKDKICEIEIHYWIFVRAPGFYEDCYDDGVRERIVIIRNSYEISKILKQFRVVASKTSCEGQQVNIVFKSNFQKWQGQLIDEQPDKMNFRPYFLTASGEKFELLDKFLPAECSKFCAVAENNFREMENTDIQRIYNHFSLNKNEVLKKVPVGYSRKYDGLPSKNPVITYVFE